MLASQTNHELFFHTEKILLSNLHDNPAIAISLAERLCKGLQRS